jgi:nitroreductase
MAFIQDPIATIQKRRSVRSYTNKPNDAIQIKRILDFMKHQPPLFSGKVRFLCIDLDKDKGVKLGTYGVIKNARSFIVAIAEDSTQDMETIGYILEKGILLATEMGLGTCWMAGTYKVNDFEGVVLNSTEERIVAITPLGFPDDKNHFLDRALRILAASDNRKPFDSLFYKNNYGEPFQPSDFNHLNEKPYYQALEMVRLAPSASNKQPWRVIQMENQYHFYLERSKNYPLRFQRIDMGIAIAHFDLVVRQHSLDGVWVFKAPPLEVPSHVQYSLTWQART